MIYSCGILTFLLQICTSSFQFLRMLVVRQSDLWWKCCEGGRNTSSIISSLRREFRNFPQSILHRTCTAGGSRPNVLVEKWLQWGGLGEQWWRTRDFGNQDHDWKFKTFNIWASQREIYTIILIDIYSQMVGEVFWHLWQLVSQEVGRDWGQKSRK